MSVTNTRDQRRCRQLRAFALVVIAALLLGSACSGEDDPPQATQKRTNTTRDGGTTTTKQRSTTTGQPSRTSTTGATSTTVGNPSAEQEVINRYVGYWDARFRANSGTPNPDDPALAEYATGAQLDAVIAETRKNLDDGRAFQPRKNPANIRRVKVISLTGDQAVVQECFVDDGLVVRRDTGAVVNDTIATHNVRGELTRVDGAWRVSRAQLIQRWEGIAGCALDS